MKKSIFSNFPLGNKKVINIMLIMIFLVSLISFSVNAAPRDIIRAGLDPIEDFFSGGWQNYEKTVAFVVFFFLFFSAFLIGAKKAFAGELTRSHKVFAFVAAFLSSMIIVTTMRFDWVNLKYVGWFLLFVLVLFLIHSLLLKMGMENHKFWAFLLALLITALLFGLIWYLMQEGRPLDGFGRISNVFSGFGKGRSRVTDKVVDKTTTTGDETTTTTPKKKKGMSITLLIIGVVVLTAGMGGVAWKIGNKKKEIRAHNRRIKKQMSVNKGFRKELKKHIKKTLKILSNPNITKEERQEALQNLVKTAKEAEVLEEQVKHLIGSLQDYSSHIGGT